ncbi:MAG: hypothetical protein FJ306_03445 [Planctomycetes bacterium]|nr:hypothetical protein [Planctomycetota bacterium]
MTTTTTESAPASAFAVISVACLMSSCVFRSEDVAVNEEPGITPGALTTVSPPSTVFPQIHTNLSGMVTEFVRVMHQDKRGNHWFGTNTNGLICYDGTALRKVAIEGLPPRASVRNIVEDRVGNVWFGTSEGLVRHDGREFTLFSEAHGLQDEEVWGMTVDARGVVWVGSTGGVSHFDGEKFRPFALPETKVVNPRSMISDKLVLDFMEDRNGTMWIVTDGNGIFQYREGVFAHLTSQNGLIDDSATGVLQDRQGHIWIGTFHGGVSRFDGKTFANFTRDGVIDGEEVGSFLEDSQGNVWFSAENHGVYRYDGTQFTRFTTADGLTSNLVLSMCEDSEGRIWLGSWQGLCIYDGEQFVNAKDKAHWTDRRHEQRPR